MGREAAFQALEALGVVNPAGSRWDQRPASTSRRAYSVQYVCRCDQRVNPAELVPFTHEGRRILIGQCQICGVVIWCEWIAEGEWTGPATLAEARGRGGRIPDGACCSHTPMKPAR